MKARNRRCSTPAEAAGTRWTRSPRALRSPPRTNVNDLDAGVTVQIASATITYFLPGTAATPPSPSKAWLVLSGSGLPYAAQSGSNAGSNEDYQKTLPPSDFTLTLPGAKPVPAMLAGQRGPDDESGDSGSWGLMAGDYYWEVPAGTRAGTLNVHLPAELAAQPGYYGGHWGLVTEVRVEGKVPSTQVAFAPLAYQAPTNGGTNPPPWAPNAGSGSAPCTGHLKTASTKLVARAGSGSGTLFVLIGVIVVLLAVLGAIGYRGFGRRRIAPALARVAASPAERTAQQRGRPPTWPLFSAPPLAQKVPRLVAGPRDPPKLFRLTLRSWPGSRSLPHHRQRGRRSYRCRRSPRRCQTGLSRCR